MALCLKTGPGSKSTTMKKKLFGVALLIAIGITTHSAKAQVSVGVHINVGDQPAWGPVGYDYAEYYYLPDIEAYYYIPRRQFVYMAGGHWVFSATLPRRYAGYDLYSGYKVVLRDPYAYHYFKDHRVRYARYRNCHNQQVVLVRRHDNGNHYGHYKKHKGHGRGGRH